ncbi:neutral zinc metallopeptidase [Microbispora sp. ATCC PTA-5024]|uniref:neutral zinc metallopeptidase n=1 Tax=Microbispora sp. ATCC PTA-5024 TaxID=316330 RepID=UPI0003DD21AD|nr:neutral zinc metallopeptidase [Microbispora sp. ATCC PTA-5024]ETK30882.1 hypothetical protein MPTA5024_37875 [Microbispora sp. ATCC PTA-5024]
MRRRLLPLLVLALVTSCSVDPPPSPILLSMSTWPTTPFVYHRPSPTPTSTGSAHRGARDVAVHNPLYEAPRPKADCRLPRMTGGWASTKKYLGAVSTCLDRVWGAEFRGMGRLYSPPKRRFIQKRVKDDECGRMPAKGATGTYCGADHVYYILPESTEGSLWNTARAAEVAAHEYAHHVQTVTDIMEYEDTAKSLAKSRAAKDLVSRRLELQAECLAGVALHAMRDEIPAWGNFRYNYQGTLADRWVRDHGRLATQLRWLEKGFTSGRPGACDTWSPKARDVT